MNNKNILLVSHQARIRCLIIKFGNASRQSLEEQQLLIKCRWQNGCVLKLNLTPNLNQSTLANICQFNVKKKGGVFNTYQDRILAIDISKQKLYNIDPANNNIQWEYPLSQVAIDATKTTETTYTTISLTIKDTEHKNRTITFGNNGDLTTFTQLILTNTSSSSCQAEMQYNFELSLLYSGKIDPNEAKGYDYWANPLPSNKDPWDNSRYHIFEPLKGTITMRELRNAFSIDSASYLHTTNSFTFYIVRHGQADHNHIKGYIKKVFREYDTNLTTLGEQMAVDAGNAINNEFVSINATGVMAKLDYLYCSDLIRTHQTFQKIISKIDDKFLHIQPALKPVIPPATHWAIDTSARPTIQLTILPCAHELEFRDDGKCDANFGVGSFFTNENKMVCTRSRTPISTCSDLQGSTPCRTPTSTCSQLLSGTNSGTTIFIIIDWSLYDTYYGNSTRTDTKLDKTICKNTSMIEECIKHIVAKEAAEAAAAQTPSGGMKLRKRQRKTKTKRKINRSKIYTYSKRRRV
jgi:broad specificity phosphatase PhoE